MINIFRSLGDRKRRIDQEALEYKNEVYAKIEEEKKP